uniref:Uncharacterized protein n=1 Tax=Anguilla anguilla TaxID=7936 RepID=A0A0E9TC16_ANGAN
MHSIFLCMYLYLTCAGDISLLVHVCIGINDN